MEDQREVSTHGSQEIIDKNSDAAKTKERTAYMEQHREVSKYGSHEIIDKKRDAKKKERTAYMEDHREVSKHGSHEINEKKKEKMRTRLIVEDDKGDINELADAFIKNFRNQLKIQRDESFKRFQEMLARGV